MNLDMFEVMFVFMVLILFWRLPEILSVSLNLEGEMSQEAKEDIAKMNRIAIIIGVTLFGAAAIIMVL